jgi:hypothetical protein
MYLRSRPRSRSRSRSRSRTIYFSYGQWSVAVIINTPWPWSWPWPWPWPWPRDTLSNPRWNTTGATIRALIGLVTQWNSVFENKRCQNYCMWRKSHWWWSWVRNLKGTWNNWNFYNLSISFQRDHILYHVTQCSPSWQMQHLWTPLSERLPRRFF